MPIKTVDLIYEGKAKKVFSTTNNDQVVIEFKNDATAFNAQKRASLEGKGEINCEISAWIFLLLRANGVPTHFIEFNSTNSLLVSRVDVVPLEVVVRNIAAGSLCKETPIAIKTEIRPPLIDYYYKDDALNDPLLTEARIKILGILKPEHKSLIESISLKVNEVLSKFFEELELLLVDFKLEFGINGSSQLVVADEFSPDNCRLWDTRSPKQNQDDRILDKDRFRKDLGGVTEAYTEVLQRIRESSFVRSQK